MAIAITYSLHLAIIMECSIATVCNIIAVILHVVFWSVVCIDPQFVVALVITNFILILSINHT